jgi:hypothetical protein
MSRESENGQKPRSHYTPCASTKRQTETGTRKSRHPPFFSNSAPDDLDIGSIDVDNDEHCLDHVPNTLHITHSASIELKHGSSDHLPPGLYPHPIAISTCSTIQRRPTPRSPTRPVGLAILCQIQAQSPLGLALHAKVSGRAHQVPVDQNACSRRIVAGGQKAKASPEPGLASAVAQSFRRAVGSSG